MKQWGRILGLPYFIDHFIILARAVLFRPKPTLRMIWCVSHPFGNGYTLAAG